MAIIGVHNISQQAVPASELMACQVFERQRFGLCGKHASLRECPCALT